MLIVKGRAKMSKVKLLHTADMHLGSLFSSLPYEKAKIRQSEQVSACMGIIKSASDCDILLLAGDVFETGCVSYDLADVFLSAIKQIDKTEVFYSCGNHDNYYTDIVSYCVKNAPPNLHIFQPDKPSVFTMEDKKTKIYGVSFSAEHCYNSYTDILPQCDGQYINILCIHGDTEASFYNPLNMNHLAKKGYNYAALGHIHSFKGINKIQNMYWAYPGIPEGRGFDECGTKGYIKGFVSNTDAKLEFYPSSKRIYIDETIDISDFKSGYEVTDVLNSIANGSENICRFTFVGENSVPKFDASEITAACNMFYAITTDNTRPHISVESYCGYANLLGLCAKETLKLCESATSIEEKEKYKRAFKLLADLYENR